MKQRHDVLIYNTHEQKETGKISATISGAKDLFVGALVLMIVKTPPIHQEGGGEIRPTMSMWDISPAAIEGER